MHRHILIPAAVIGLVAVSVSLGQAADTADKDLKRLQGRWQLQSTFVKGGAVPNSLVSRVQLTIKGSEWKQFYKQDDGTVSITRLTFTIDSGKAPKQINISYRTDEGKKTRKGIYELRGDVLKIAHNEPTTNERPRAFPGASYIETWKRLK